MILERSLLARNPKLVRRLKEMPDRDPIKSIIRHDNVSALRHSVVDRYSRALNNLSSVYIFGAKLIGEKIAKDCQGAGIEVKAFLDNDEKMQNTCVHGIPVIKPSQAKERDTTVIIASQHLFDISCQLTDYGFLNALPYLVLSVYNSTDFPPDPMNEGLLEDMACSVSRYSEFYELLYDKRSKDTLLDLLRFRTTFDPRYLHSAGTAPELVYFDNFISLSGAEVFVDGGGFNGDTVNRFLTKTKGIYKKIHFFEPDLALLSQARQNLAGYSNIEFYGEGLFSKDDIMSFNATGGLDGRIIDNGELPIKVRALDNAVDEEVTFIKLDVEGAELAAIEGARRHIENELPVLAVCVYHNPYDLWRLPLFIKSISNEYNYFLRHYGQAVTETVIYCVPQEKKTIVSDH